MDGRSFQAIAQKCSFPHVTSCLQFLQLTTNQAQASRCYQLFLDAFNGNGNTHSGILQRAIERRTWSWYIQYLLESGTDLEHDIGKADSQDRVINYLETVVHTQQAEIARLVLGEVEFTRQYASDSLSTVIIFTNLESANMLIVHGAPANACYCDRRSNDAHRGATHLMMTQKIMPTQQTNTSSAV